jgi:hypothetical protein
MLRTIPAGTPTLQHFSRRNGLVNDSQAIQQKYDRYNQSRRD